MARVKNEVSEETVEKVNCLRNAKIIVRYVNSQGSRITDKRHPLYGGMSNEANRTFCVPKLSNGHYVNVLTNEEKDYLEEILGLEINALSIYKKKEDNYWSSLNPAANVTLQKADNFLDLSIPSDYIKYKILLANKNTICPSLEELEKRPKATYQFVILDESEENKQEQIKMNSLMTAYKEYGKIEEDKQVLRVVIELLTGTVVDKQASMSFMQVKINDLIQKDAKKFLSVVQDPLLKTKVLINKAIEDGIISKRGDFLYLKETNKPLCDDNQDPTLQVAAKYLNLPKNQEMLFNIQAKLKID